VWFSSSVVNVNYDLLFRRDRLGSLIITKTVANVAAGTRNENRLQPAARKFTNLNNYGLGVRRFSVNLNPKGSMWPSFVDALVRLSC
jgi:hypothetical protein